MFWREGSVLKTCRSAANFSCRFKRSGAHTSSDQRLPRWSRATSMSIPYKRLPTVPLRWRRQRPWVCSVARRRTMGNPIVALTATTADFVVGLLILVVFGIRGSAWPVTQCRLWTLTLMTDSYTPLYSWYKDQHCYDLAKLLFNHLTTKSDRYCCGINFDG